VRSFEKSAEVADRKSMVREEKKVPRKKGVKSVAVVEKERLICEEEIPALLRA